MPPAVPKCPQKLPVASDIVPEVMGELLQAADGDVELAQVELWESRALPHIAHIGRGEHWPNVLDRSVQNLGLGVFRPPDTAFGDETVLMFFGFAVLSQSLRWQLRTVQPLLKPVSCLLAFRFTSKLLLLLEFHFFLPSSM